MTFKSYFKDEYNYDEEDLILNYGSDYSRLKTKLERIKLLEPKSLSEESALTRYIDEFMLDKRNELKRRKWS